MMSYLFAWKIEGTKGLSSLSLVIIRKFSKPQRQNTVPTMMKRMFTGTNLKRKGEQPTQSPRNLSKYVWGKVNFLNLNHARIAEQRKKKIATPTIIRNHSLPTYNFWQRITLTGVIPIRRSPMVSRVTPSKLQQSNFLAKYPSKASVIAEMP